MKPYVCCENCLHSRESKKYYCFCDLHHKGVSTEDYCKDYKINNTMWKSWKFWAAVVAVILLIVAVVCYFCYPTFCYAVSGLLIGGLAGFIWGYAVGNKHE